MPNVDVFSLSDEDLQSQLLAHGVECGPIVETTRRTYQRKLARVFSEGAGPGRYDAATSDTQPIDEVDYSQEEDEEEEEEEDYVPEPLPQSREPLTNPNLLRRPLSAAKGGRTPPGAQHIPRQMAEPTPPAPAPQKKGLPIWIQLLVLVIVAAFIFIVFQNMEPASQVPTRQLASDEV